MVSFGGSSAGSRHLIIPAPASKPKLGKTPCPVARLTAAPPHAISRPFAGPPPMRALPGGRGVNPSIGPGLWQRPYAERWASWETFLRKHAGS